MARFTEWISQVFSTIPDDYIEVFREQEYRRKIKIWRTQKDMVDAGTSLGLSSTQIDSTIDSLFSTFPGEWSAFVLTGAEAIITAIQDDTTLNFLNAEYPPGSGVTIRERLVNRLSE